MSAIHRLQQAVKNHEFGLGNHTAEAKRETEFHKDCIATAAEKYDSFASQWVDLTALGKDATSD